MDVTVLFSGALGHGIGTFGMLRMILVVGKVLGNAVDGGRRGVYEPVDIMICGGLEDSKEATNVVRVVLFRLFDARTDPRLRGLVENNIHTTASDDFLNNFLIGDRALHELKAVVSYPSAGAEVTTFYIEVVVGVEIVQRDDTMAVREETFNEVRPDEPRTTCDQYLHGLPFRWSSFVGSGFNPTVFQSFIIARRDRSMCMDTELVQRYLDKNPTAYAGLRALDVSSKGREQTVAEKDEVPFIFTVAFVPLIIAYTGLKRTAYLLRYSFGSNGSTPVSPPDHIFVMTSTHAYRTYTFEEVGSRLLDDGEDVMFLCSPSATDRTDGWRAKGFRTESFTQLLRFVRLSELLAHVVRAVIAMYRLRRVTSGEFQESSVTYAFNSIFLEYIKFSSVKLLVRDDPTVHTYSLMPYLVRATTPERLYVYQHGVQRKPEDDEWAATTFFPATLFVWGEAWIQNYKELVHPEMRIRATGSPWHDHLSQSRDSNGAMWDILFIGGSQATTHSEEWERRYEELVGSLVRACNENDWSLAIKLHPIESSDWYREHGWENYIVEFESMEEALNSADIAVTHFSSAFVESIATGTPIILSEVWSYGLSEIRPIEGGSFIYDDLEGEIRRIRQSSRDVDDIVEHTQLLNIGQSVTDMLNVVSNNE